MGGATHMPKLDLRRALAHQQVERKRGFDQRVMLMPIDEAVEIELVAPRFERHHLHQPGILVAPFEADGGAIGTGLDHLGRDEVVNLPDLVFKTFVNVPGVVLDRHVAIGLEAVGDGALWDQFALPALVEKRDDAALTIEPGGNQGILQSRFGDFQIR